MQAYVREQDGAMLCAYHAALAIERGEDVREIESIIPTRCRVCGIVTYPPSKD